MFEINPIEKGADVQVLRSDLCPRSVTCFSKKKNLSLSSIQLLKQMSSVSAINPPQLIEHIVREIVIAKGYDSILRRKICHLSFMAKYFRQDHAERLPLGREGN